MAGYLDRAAGLVEEQADPGGAFRQAWRAEARPEQLPPEGRYRTWYVRGGRGGGKTWAAAHTLAEWILADPEPGEWGIVAPTYQLAWSVCVEGESGLLAALGTNVREIRDGKSRLVEHWHRSFAQIKMRSGHIVWVASAQDGGVGIQGKNLRAAWCDEIGMWDQWELTWNESLMYAVRKGTSRIIATGTPKKARRAKKLVKMLLDDPEVPVSALRTLDNAANLSEAFLKEVVGKAKGTRLERQELEGVLLDDTEGALWTAENIEDYRVPVPPADLIRVVVAVDPAVSNEEGSDETGIMVVGEGANGHGFVLEDCSMRGSPDECMKRAVRAYYQWQADRVIGEANNGGDYIGTLLATVDPNVPYRKVIATRGKRVRAEPVSALYEQGRMHHAGHFQDLEDQMCEWVPSDPESPDRVDALVWACAELKGLSAGSWLEAYGTVRCKDCESVYAERYGACPACHPEVRRKAQQQATAMPAKEASGDPEPITGWASAYGAVKCARGHVYIGKLHKTCPRCRPGGMAQRPGFPRAGGW